MLPSEFKPSAAPVRLLPVPTAATALASCETESSTGGPARETLPNGAILVRYPGLPAVNSVAPEVAEARVEFDVPYVVRASVP